MPNVFPFFDEYNARKVGTNRETLEVIRKVESFNAPSWWRWEAGFNFIWDNSHSILLGFGGYRDTKRSKVILAGELLYHLDMKEPGILFTFFYKGEWHIADILKTEAFWKHVQEVKNESAF